MGPVTDILRDLKNKTSGAWKCAHNYYMNGGSRRDQLAEQAASDHRGRAEALLRQYRASGDIYELRQQLCACRDHAEAWERQFLQWSRSNKWDNEYATFVHGEAASFYREALDQLDSEDPDIDENKNARVRLHLILINEGGSKGRYSRVVEVVEGFESNVELSSELAWKISAKAEASGSLFGAKLSASIGGDVGRKVADANSYKATSARTVKINVEIDLSRPAYIYQLQSVVPMVNAGPVTLYGGLIITSRRLC